MFSMDATQQFKTMSERSTPEGRLENICEILNEEKDKERGRELVALLKEWMAAPSLAAMLRDNVGLAMELHYCAEHPTFIPGKKRKYGVYQTLPAHPRTDDDHSFTVWMFANLVTNPVCEKLAGPCARCGNYYIKKRTSQNVYCSRKCGNAATAVVRTRQRVKDERDAKMTRAKAAIREWKKADTSEDWKPWVAVRAKVDPRFLTRAFNKGQFKNDLHHPKKGRKP
jgi:hypothetical protein